MRRAKNGSNDSQTAVSICWAAAMSTAAIIATAALADNIVLAYMLGLCPFAGLSRRLDVAVGVGVATLLVLTASAAGAWAVNAMLLRDMPSLQPLVFIALAAVFVQAAELAMRLWTPLMHRLLGIYLPLIATNCAVLGVMLLAVRESPHSFGDAVARGFGGGLVFLLALLSLALLREKMVEMRAPAVMRGAPLTMLTAGWMALAFSGLTGLTGVMATLIILAATAGAVLGFLRAHAEGKDCDAPLTAALDAALPQLQCGECGYVGCRPYAVAMARGEAGINLCPPGGDDTARQLGRILNTEPPSLSPAPPRMVAFYPRRRLCGLRLMFAGVSHRCHYRQRPTFRHTVLAEHCVGCRLCLPPCPTDCIDMRAIE